MNSPQTFATLECASNDLEIKPVRNTLKYHLNQG